MRGVGLLAVVALLVVDNELDLERLLEHCVAVDFLLDCQLDLQSSRMGLRPDERRVEQFDKLEPFHISEAQSEELCALELTLDPWGSLVPVALSAVLQDVATRDAFCDIDLTFEAVNACVGCIRCSHDATNAASDLMCFQKGRIHSNSAPGSHTTRISVITLIVLFHGFFELSCLCKGFCIIRWFV